MAINSVESVRIDAIYAAVPDSFVLTKDYENFTQEEARVFEKNTGIFKRRVAPENVTCSDLCEFATHQLLNDFPCNNEIDILVFVSQSPDYFLPATAIVLQDKLGIPKNCLAFDVNLGCSGYVYGLQIIGQFLQSKNFRKALLLVGDKSTISTHHKDKSTFPLFGDAGTATLLSYDSNAKTMYFDLGSDGSGRNAIIIPAGHSRMPYGTYDDSEINFSGGLRSLKHLNLDGLAVFNFALDVVPKTIKNVLDSANVAPEEVDFFVLHQANGLITKSIYLKLGISKEKFLESISEFGNTSSASIPLTLCHSNIEDDGNEKSWLFCGFGVGFSWATVYLKHKAFNTKLLVYGRN